MRRSSLFPTQSTGLYLSKYPIRDTCDRFSPAPLGDSPRSRLHSSAPAVHLRRRIFRTRQRCRRPERAADPRRLAVHRPPTAVGSTIPPPRHLRRRRPVLKVRSDLHYRRCDYTKSPLTTTTKPSPLVPVHRNLIVAAAATATKFHSGPRRR